MDGDDGGDDEDIDAGNECFTKDSYCEGLPAISLKVNHKDYGWLPGWSRGLRWS